MAQQQADALASARGGGPRPRTRSRRAGRAVPGRGPRRRNGIGRSGAARPVRARGRAARFCRNVAAPGVRRQPRGDAARRRRSHRGGRSSDPDDPPALRRALHHRDQGCRFPGCGLPFGQGHHVRHWAQGGPTTLSNLALLCRRHHRAVHEEGYQVDRQPDGALRFRRPDGRPLPEVPPPPAVPADPVQALRAQHDAQGLRLHARTACPSWLGERLDVVYAIDVLHPLANATPGLVQARGQHAFDGMIASPAVRLFRRARCAPGRTGHDEPASERGDGDPQPRGVPDRDGAPDRARALHLARSHRGRRLNASVRVG